MRTVAEPRAGTRRIQIAHGLGEHSGRYAGTIAVLQDAGLTVYANDHRGHGRTAASPEHLGDFGEGGFDLLVRRHVSADAHRQG